MDREKRMCFLTMKQIEKSKVKMLHKWTNRKEWIHNEKKMKKQTKIGIDEKCFFYVIEGSLDKLC